jgi:hypothetical protein
MRFLLLAVDYDGTLACDGTVDDKTIEALVRLRASGRKVLLATGRHLPDLQSVFPKLELFDRVVAENGGLLYHPATREERLLGEAPNPQFVSLLKKRGVPIAVGRVVVATWQPHETAVLNAIRELGLDLHVIFNKGTVMVLPSGVNKGSGVRAALDELGISPHNVVPIGDAENDHSFLRISECGVAVANALPALKARADVVLDAARGAGVVDLIERLLADDLAQFEPKLGRHSISLGQGVRDGAPPVSVSQRGGSILVAGPSGSGKSTAVSGIIEQLVHQGYQICLLDPEGDYEGSPDVLSFGTAREAPDTKAALRTLELSEVSVLVDLLAVSLDDRPGFLSSLLPAIQSLRLHTGRPHWLVIDEAHHLLPSSWSPVQSAGTLLLETAILVTIHPEHVAKTALDLVNVVIAVGKSPMQTLRVYSQTVQASPPPGGEVELATGEALVWFRRGSEPPHSRENGSEHTRTAPARPPIRRRRTFSQAKLLLPWPSVCAELARAEFKDVCTIGRWS